jgi:hypothetical protein
MKTLRDIPALRKIAADIVWFETPNTSLRDVNRFLVYAMTYATTREVAVLRKHVSIRQLDTALRAAPPGIMDKRSWAYWNAMCGRYPPPPMPSRSLKRSKAR